MDQFISVPILRSSQLLLRSEQLKRVDQWIKKLWMVKCCSNHSPVTIVPIDYLSMFLTVPPCQV